MCGRCIEYQEALDADEERDEPDGLHGCPAHRLGEPRAKQGADGSRLPGRRRFFWWYLAPWELAK